MDENINTEVENKLKEEDLNLKILDYKELVDIINNTNYEWKRRGRPCVCPFDIFILKIYF